MSCDNLPERERKRVTPLGKGLSRSDWGLGRFWISKKSLT